MGGFEIILIAIGIGWTIISGIVKNVEESKKKKARAAEVSQTAETVIEDAPLASRPDDEISLEPRSAPATDSGVRGKFDAGLQKLREERIKQIRRRMGLEAATAAQPAKQPPKPPVVKVPPKKVAPVAAAAPPAPSTPPRMVKQPLEATQGARERILAMAGSPHGLRDAVVLSELLAPPVALRAAHLD